MRKFASESLLCCEVKGCSLDPLGHTSPNMRISRITGSVELASDHSKDLQVSFIILLPWEMLFKLADVLTESKACHRCFLLTPTPRGSNAKERREMCSFEKCAEAIKFTRNSRGEM